ncbi:MAG TPA: CARDB domain-containing protein, partial [Vicinamibacteria bacterium]
MVLPASAFAIQKPRPEDRVLPNFDTRFRGPRAATIPPEVEKALAGLRRQTSLTLEARFHPLSRAVRVLSAREGALTPPSAEAPEEVARGFLRAHRDLFALSEADVSSLVRTREYRSHGERIRHVQFQQVSDGIPVFGAVVGVHLDEAGRVVFVSNNALPAQGATGAASSAPASRLAAEDAIRAAVANVRPELALEPQLVSPPSGRERRATFARGPLKRDIPARLVYFPGRPRPRLAWRLLVEPAGFPQAYDIVVDAETGQVVYRRNRVYYADGVANVVQSEATALRDARLLDEHPGGSAAASGADPETGCPPLTGYSSRSLTAPFRDPGTVLFSAGRLAGNNARAYRGSVGAFGALGTADGGGSWHFEFPFDTAESAEAHLFFAANFLHDFFYDLGFDEAAGNFQVDNLGRGGLGGDPLNALARADGRNNATFEPQPEGVSPTMSMFLFDGVGCWSEDVDGDGEPDLDGDYDSDIFIHEYHHGVSHRLNTDFTGDEADAMGDGGSDFFAYSINGNTKLAEYVAPPDGIRQVNAKTYADWACYDFFFFFICEPHDSGEIWANTLWDMREQFRADLVKGSEAAAVNEVHQLYVDGLKLSPGSPTMLDMRDAMLQADQDRNPSGDIGGSENYCRMWLAFAGRGLGIHARDTQDTGDATVVADTSLPAICPAPPPKPTVTVTASDPTAAEAGLDTASFTFTRNGSTDAALVVGYTVAGSATPGSDYVRLSGTVTIPAGAADATVILTPLDDPLVEGDETVEVDLAVSSAYVIGAPASAIARIVSEDVAPDLLVFVTAPYLIAPGVPVTLADTTSNQGTGVSTASVTRFYLSRDGAIDAADIVLGSRTVPPVAVGASSSGSTSVTIPAGTVAGEYVVIAEADSDRTNDEMVETNNNGYAAVRIGADLIITAISSFTSGAGEAVTLSDTTYNVGAGAAPASVTRYYLSANPVVDAADILLGSRAVPALASRTGSSGAITATIPVGTPAGVYNLIGQADGDGTVPETQETNNTSYSIVYVGPDLAIAAVAAPATGGAGSAVTVSDTTKNLGGGGASASLTRFYLSANNVLDAADTLLGSRPVPALAAGATSAGSTTLTIPAAQAPGTYFLLAQADGNDTVPEHCEVNNLNWAVIQIGPDLTITTLTAPPSAGPGMAVTVGDTTRNQGGGNAAASITKFYLSTNAILEAGDTLLGSRPVPALAAGATSAGSATVTIPAGTGPGTYYVIAQADGDGAVAETSESNNVATAAFQLGPDLVVSPLTAPPSSGAGAAIVVNDTTVNQGAGPAAASVTRFYLSANAVLDFSDTLLGSRAVSALAAAASSSGSTTVTIPAGTAPGQYYVIAQADGQDSIAEVQEGNNTAAVAIQIGPDLIVNAFTAPATSGTGSAFTVSETTRNQAGGVSAACVTKFFLSADTTLDAADTLVGSRSVPALGPGASSAVSTALTVPAGTAAGLYYLFAQADGDGTVAETSETNNTSLVSIQVGPDLMVASLLGPAAAGAGTAISVSDTTRNQGGGSAVPSATRIYLSTNALLDAGDTLLGGRTVPALAAGSSSA